ncbi:TRAP transporter small permease [Pseudomonas sp. ABY48]|uniref:TRAP transporter small permease n=1 Tax=Pseudomonas sp. ABY48 TaxID=3402865 RepID=UPI003B43C1BB
MWEHFEEAFIAFLLAAMTLVTFVYVVLNNLYTVFYSLGDHWSAASEPMFAIGDNIMGMAQAMTWSTSLTKALFGWLIFFGLSYGVRTAGHIGVDALVKLASKPVQRFIGVIACLCCLAYAGLLAVASYEWINTLMIAQIGAEDLGHFGIMQWHIGLIVPVGFALVFIRFAEILVRILMNRQTGLGLADEAAEAMKLTEHEEDKP